MADSPQSQNPNNQASPPTPGSPKPPRKRAPTPNEQQKQEMDDYMYELISRNYLKSQIKAQFRKKFGDMSARTIENYIARARVRINAEAARNKEDMRADSRAFYETIARDPQTSPRDKLIARERIDRLFGLEAPQRIAPTDPSGDNPYVGLDRDELIGAILTRAAARGTGEDPPGDGREGQGEHVTDQAGQVCGTDDESQT